MINWDYHIPKNWQPKTPEEWEWYLVRKINYEDLSGIQKKVLKEYFPKIKNKLDTGKRILLDNFLYHT